MKQSAFPERVTAFLFAAALAALLLSGCASGGDAVERFADAEPADSGQIAIPGFETLYFAAGRTRQSVDFPNPKENACLFRLSLTLDGGETLWTSGDLKPGERVTALTFSRPLDAGEYAATLKYDCFTLQDGQPLNGAEIQLTIDVKPQS